MPRFKLFSQLEATDCGPACLQMICNYWGCYFPLQFIKKGFNVSRIGVSIVDIVNRAKELNLDSLIAKSDPGKLQSEVLPVIVHWRNNHFVVLYKITTNRKGHKRFHVADPSNGKIIFSEEEFCKNTVSSNSQCVAIIFRPNTDFHKQTTIKEQTDWTSVKKIAKSYNVHRLKLIISFTLLLLSMIFGWCVPYIYQIIIDEGVISSNISLIWQLFVVQLAFFIGYTFSNTASAYIICKLNFHVSADFIEELLYKLMRLPIKYFDTRLSSDFIQRLDDFTRLRVFLSDKLINLLFAIINVIVYFSLLCYYSITAALIFILLSSIGFLWNQYYTRERKFIDYSLFVNKAVNRNILYEVINGMSDIKANNAQIYQVSN